MLEPVSRTLMLELIPRLRAAFPKNMRADELPTLASVYCDGLRGCSTDAVRHAVGQAIQNDQYFPKVSRLRELVADYNRRTAVMDAHTHSDQWCEQCHTNAEWIRRWTVAVDEQRRVRLSDDGLWVLLTTVERCLCRCASPSLYAPNDDAPDPPAMLRAHITWFIGTQEWTRHQAKAS